MHLGPFGHKITNTGRNEKVRREMNVGPFGPTHDASRVALPLPRTSTERPMGVLVAMAMLRKEISRAESARINVMVSAKIENRKDREKNLRGAVCGKG